MNLLLMEALVDHTERFIDIYMGCTSKVHEARVIWRPSVFKYGQAGTLSTVFGWKISGVSVPTVIMGDLAYPLLPWLIKAYPGVGSHGRRQSDYALSRWWNVHLAS